MTYMGGLGHIKTYIIEMSSGKYTFGWNLTINRKKLWNEQKRDASYSLYRYNWDSLL